jgi:hypothetical protein
MKTLRVWMALSWIGLIVVMSAGSFLLRPLRQGWVMRRLLLAQNG